MIDSKRLHIRPIELSDWEFVQKLASTDDFVKYIANHDVSTEEKTVAYMQEKMISHHEKYGYGNYIVEDKKKKTPVGTVSLFFREKYGNPDIGYALLPEHYGNGYAYEAASILMSYGHMVHGMKTINGFCRDDNTHSINVLKKLGMKKIKKVKWSDESEPRTLYFSIEY